MRILLVALAGVLLTHCPSGDVGDDTPIAPDIVPPPPPDVPPPEPFPPNGSMSSFCSGQRVNVRSIELEPPSGPDARCEPGEDCRVAEMKLGFWLGTPQLYVTLNSGRTLFGQPDRSQTSALWGEHTVPSGQLESTGDFENTCRLEQPRLLCSSIEESMERFDTGGQDFNVLEASDRFACAMTPEGVPHCFGRIACNPCFESGGFVQMALARTMACFLHESGAAHCISDGSHDVVEKHEGPFVELDGGGEMICGLGEDGRVFCWGDVEPPPFESSSLPPCTCHCEDEPWEIPALQGATSIAVGRAHVCAIREEGDVVCWGRGERGQLGDGYAAHTRSTTLGLVGVVEIDATQRTTCARREDDSIWCWGERGTLPLVGQATQCDTRICVGTPQPLTGFGG